MKPEVTVETVRAALEKRGVEVGALEWSGDSGGAIVPEVDARMRLRLVVRALRRGQTFALLTPKPKTEPTA